MTLGFQPVHRKVPRLALCEVQLSHPESIREPAKHRAGVDPDSNGLRLVIWIFVVKPLRLCSTHHVKYLYRNADLSAITDEAVCEDMYQAHCKPRCGERSHQINCNNSYYIQTKSGHCLIKMGGVPLDSIRHFSSVCQLVLILDIRK